MFLYRTRPVRGLLGNKGVAGHRSGKEVVGLTGFEFLATEEILESLDQFSLLLLDLLLEGVAREVHFLSAFAVLALIED
jgi:hypothetical protein